MTSARNSQYSTTVVARTLFGPEIDSANARKIWELSTPTDQCKGSMGAGPFKKGVECYICGLPIIHSGIKNDGRNPECEHLLPILMAVMYLQLYSYKETKSKSTGNAQTSTGNAQTPWYNQELIDLEYAWAHRTCNQIKSDDIYIYVDDNGQFEVDINGLKKLLKTIWDTKINDYKIFIKDLHKKYKNKNGFINKRINSNLITKFHFYCYLMICFNNFIETGLLKH